MDDKLEKDFIAPWKKAKLWDKHRGDIQKMKKENVVPLLSKALDIRVRTETQMKEMLKKQLASSRKAHHMSKKSKGSVVD